MTNLFEMQDQETVKNIEYRKLNKITIQNYRNIDYKEIVLNGSNLSLEGDNGIGKTNIIEAIFWCITGNLFDGTAKTESQEILPNGAERDTTVNVKLEFDYDNFSFERTVSQKWSKDTYKGTDTKLSVNGAVMKNQTIAMNALMNYLGLSNLTNQFNIIPNLQGLNVVDFLYNLYSFKRLDYKVIREIIIAMVGDADFNQIIKENQEKYKLLIEPLKLHGNDLGALKTSNKKAIDEKELGLKAQISKTKSNIEEYEKDGAKVASKEEIENAKTELSKIDKEIKKVESQKTKTDDEKIDIIKSNITEYQNKIYERQNELREEYNKELDTYNQNSNLTAINQKEQSIAKKKQERITLSGIISTKEIARDRLQSALDSKNIELERETKELNRIKERFLKAKKVHSHIADDSNECPVCGTLFDLNTIDEEGRAQTKLVKGIKSGIEELTDDITIANEEILKKQNERNDLDKAINKLSEEIEELKKSDETLKQPILDLESDKAIKDYRATIKTLETSRNALKNADNTFNDNIDEKISQLEESKESFNKIINSETTAKSYQENAKEKRKELKSLQNKLQEKEDIKTLIKELEKEMFESLDSRIGNIFGENVQIKLWKLNVSNGEYDTRMCEVYVKDDWGEFVNIKHINDGIYPIRAIEIMSKIKDYYQIPKSFIYLDKSADLDEKHMEWLKSFDEQILATKVVSGIKTIKERKF